MRLGFHGAARTVTGSRHLLEVGGRRILLDCGLFQGRRMESERKNRSFGFAPDEVDAVVLSHAHIDHSGALPSLVKHGFAGAVHCTLATADLLSVMLRDSAMIQGRDAEFVSKIRARRGEPPVEPLYDERDVAGTMAMVEGHRYHAPVPIVPGVRATFYDAGHILGSSIVDLEIEEGGTIRHLVFTGDLGRVGLPILRDPERPPACDVLVIESTYGDREHAPIASVDERLAALVNRVVLRRGKLIIPAFAVGRTQEVVYALARLIRAGAVPRCQVFVDSPMAVDVTEIFARHPECFDDEVRQALADHGDPFGFELMTYVRDPEASKALNHKAGPFLVVSASGMCEAGRIRHHLKNGVEDAKNAILIVGYQAPHTLGRRLVDGDREVAIFGEPYRRNAEVVVMDEFSAHADRHDLLAWVTGFRRPPGRAFVVHGEPEQAEPFAAALRQAGIAEVTVPDQGDEHEA
jgi:metallo-beta-lactamase family protein